MSEVLKHQIRTRMQEQQITVAEIERRAGLKVNALRNILLGHSKKPSAETLQAIADVLSCSVKDLLDRQGFHESLSQPIKEAILSRKAEATPWRHKLLQDIISFGENLFEEHGIEPTLEQVLPFCRKVYIYSLKKNDAQLDQKFAEWVFEQTFLKN